MIDLSLVARGLGPIDSYSLSRLISCKRLLVYPHTKEVLTFLKDQGCHLYLLSNAQAAFTNIEIDLMELRSCFDTIYLSSDAGICKPQPEFLK